MPTSNLLEWEITPLSMEDELLIEAYQRAGRSVDELAYTDEFERICHEIGMPLTDSARHVVFQRLLNLRKQGRLPRVHLVNVSDSLRLRDTASGPKA